MVGRMNIKLKRAYEEADSSDGIRILVERLWPRGVTKTAAALDHWFPDIAPRPELRTWFAHRRERWSEFQKRYRAELRLANEQLAPATQGLSRFFSEDVADGIITGRISTNLGGDSLEASIKFCDIRNSTPLGERLSPDQIETGRIL